MGGIGALGFRALFIFLGARAIERWDWVVYVFGVVLILAAIRVFWENPAEQEENRAVAWLSRHLPVTPKVHGARFLVRKRGSLVATPLLIAILGLELTDVMFAVDSVPAAFSVTRDTTILYTSNAFAILGLRALYIVLEQTLAHLRYLHYGLAGILLFAGIKLIVADWVHVPAMVSVAVIFVLVGGAAWASVWWQDAGQGASAPRRRAAPG